VVELNTDAQLAQLIRMHSPGDATKVRAANHNDGLPLTAHWVTSEISHQESKH
jgi:hypothetical protein